MCKYCDNIKEEIDSLERQDADLLGQQGVGTDLIIVKKGDKYYFNVIGSFDSVKESVEIEFCPVCGRKLDGDLSCYNNYPLVIEDTPYNQTSAVAIEEAWRAVPVYTGYCGSTASCDTTARRQKSYKTAEEYYNKKYNGGTSNDALLKLVDETLNPERHWRSGGGLSG